MNRPRRRSRRRLLIAAVTCLAIGIAASDGFLLTTGHAQQDDSVAANFDIYNGQVAAAADREQVGTQVDVGFSGGAVDNFYPLARTDVAVAGASATASPADTGPLAQAVFGGQNVVQPQYVNAQYPGDQHPPSYSAASASASASVTPASGLATATEGAEGTSTTAPPGTQPDGTDGDTATVSSYFDPALGFVTIGDSRVQHASYGGGVLVLNDVRVLVQVSTTGSGTFTKSIAVTVGSAFVGNTTVGGGTTPLGPTLPSVPVPGIPVTINQDGISVPAGPLVPFGDVQGATAAANAALARAGLSVHTVAPQTTQQGGSLHVDAEGVVVDFEQPPGAPSGVPTQSARHTLGEVVLDNEAYLAPPAQTFAAPTPDSNTGGAPPVISNTTILNAGSSTTTTAPSSTSTSRTGAQRPTVPVAATLTLPRPRWLILAYLAWQALMIALVGSMYLQRAARRRAA